VVAIINGSGAGPGPGWQPMPVPKRFDYEMWLGPAPRAPYHIDRCLYRFRFHLDYSGGVELICRTQEPGFGARFEGSEGWIQYTYNKIEASSEGIKESLVGAGEGNVRQRRRGQ
jgi:hypothetical protein